MESLLRYKRSKMQVQASYMNMENIRGVVCRLL